MVETDRPQSFDELLPRIRAGLSDASSILCCLDFDGTLAPIVEDPADATMTSATRAAIASLADEPSVRTAVVSGRALSDVRERVGLPITYAGNHGLELARNGTIAVHPIARKRSRTISAVCDALEIALDPIPNCRIENKRLTGTVHVRSVPEPARKSVRRITNALVERIGGDALETSPGKCIVEIEPALEWGKGDAVELIEADYDGDPFVLYVGDDVTDESAFRAVQPNGVGVLVGRDRESAADCCVESPAEVASLLHWIATAGVDVLSSGRDSPRTTRQLSRPGAESK